MALVTVIVLQARLAAAMILLLVPGATRPRIQTMAEMTSTAAYAGSQKPYLALRAGGKPKP